MDYHHHARLTIYSREQLAKSVAEGRLSLREAAAECRLSRQSAAKWVRRYREAGLAGLQDRSSRPQRSPCSTPAEVAEQVERRVRERWTGVRIAQATGLSRATVSRILTRLRLNKIRMLEPQVPVVRYEPASPGDLLHVDIKKFARIVKAGHRITGNPQDETRGAGWEFLYVAVDDHSRIAYTAMYPDETANSSASFLGLEAAAYFHRLGITVRRVLTDNGPCFYAHRFSPSRLSRSRHHPQAHPHLTPREPMEKRNASSRPPCVNGPTRVATRTPRNDPHGSDHGPTSTTGTDLMLALAKHPPHQPIRTRGQQPLETPQLKPPFRGGGVSWG